MKYEEILPYLDEGCTVRSCDCEYKIINDVINWRFIGEETWTPLINSEELIGNWNVIVD